MEDLEVEKGEIFRQKAKLEAGVIDNALDGVEVASKVGEVVDKVEEPQEAEEKPLLLSKLSRPLLDLEVEKEEIFRQKAAARHSMSLGRRSCW